MRIALAATVLALGLAGAGWAGPPVGPSTKGPVKVLRVKPLTLQVTGTATGTTVVVHLGATTNARSMRLAVGSGGVVKVGVNGASCTRPITMVTVSNAAGTRLGSVRLPIPECAPQE